jgi:hypothetical protein
MKKKMIVEMKIGYVRKGEIFVLTASEDIWITPKMNAYQNHRTLTLNFRDSASIDDSLTADLSDSINIK